MKTTQGRLTFAMHRAMPLIKLTTLMPLVMSITVPNQTIAQNQICLFHKHFFSHRRKSYRPCS
jgi:energy-coupling factor transporter transmembrane protein EcfT